MPINFAAIVAEFMPLMQPQVNLITESFERLAKWLKPHWLRTRDMFEATRDFPVLEFYNGALTVSLDRGQYGYLGVSPDHPNRRGSEEPDLSPLGRLVEGGLRFWDGLRQVPIMIEQEFALPRLLSTLAEMAEAILDSLERFAHPTREMFRLAGHTASDLLGEAALFWRAITSYSGIMDVVATGIGAFQVREAIKSVSSGEAQEIGPARSWIDSLADVVRGITGVILLLPTGMALISAILDTAILALKIRVLRGFQGIERQVLDVRRSVLDLFYGDNAGLGLMAQDFLQITVDVLLSNVTFYVEFLSRYFERAIPELRRFSTELGPFLASAFRAIGSFIASWGAFFDRDLWDFLAEGRGFSTLVKIKHFVMGSDPDPPPITIGELVEILTGTGSDSKRDPLLAYTRFKFGNWRYVPYVRARILALERLLQGPTRSATPLPGETTAPPASPVFPDLYQVWFGVGRPDLLHILGEMLDPVRIGVHDALSTGSTLLGDIGGEFARAAAREARTPFGPRFTGIERFSTSFADRTFGEERRGLRSRIAQQPFDPFLALVRAGGFQVIGQVVPRYIEQMDSYWRSRLRDLPVSPLILARRKKLTVRVPRMSVDATGQQLDDSLIDRIAASFKEAVENSYRTGAMRNLAGAG